MRSPKPSAGWRMTRRFAFNSVEAPDRMPKPILSATPFWSTSLGFKLDVALTLLRHKLLRRLWKRTMAYDPNNIFHHGMAVRT